MTNISNITGKYEQVFLNDTADKQRVDAPANPAEADKTDRVKNDKVSLSDASRDMQTARQAVASTPDIRTEKFYHYCWWYVTRLRMAGMWSIRVVSLKR